MKKYQRKYQCIHNGWTAIICPECSRKEKIIIDAQTISSGTIGNLIGSSKYSDIEEAQQKFTLWLIKENSKPFEDWRIAWGAFIEATSSSPTPK